LDKAGEGQELGKVGWHWSLRRSPLGVIGRPAGRSPMFMVASDATSRARGGFTHLLTQLPNMQPDSRLPLGLCQSG